MAVNTINLEKFDINKIDIGDICLIIGKRATGKSILTKDILHHNNYQNMPTGMVINVTESATPFYNTFIPETNIISKYNPKLFNAFVKKQTMAIETNKDTDINSNAYIVVDNAFYDNTWTKNKKIQELFSNTYNLKTLFIITSPYYLRMPSDMQSDIEYIFILKETNVSDIKRLYDNYAKLFCSFGDFCKIMEQYTDDYNCLVIDNTTPNNRIESRVFLYKADLH